MLLETVFTILMSGLMVHVGDDNDTAGKEKEFVAILHENDHIAAIVAEGSSLSPKTSDILFLPLMPKDRIALDLPAGDAGAANFSPGVPGLHLLGGDLDVEIQEEKDDARVSYLDYPAGELTVAEWFSKKGKFVQDGNVIEEICVPRVTKFTAKTTQTVVTLTVTHSDGTTTTAQLQPDAVIRLVNAPTPLAKGSHFARYKKLSKKATKISDVEDGSACGMKATGMPPSSAKAGGLIHILVADQPECTNTDWP